MAKAKKKAEIAEEVATDPAAALVADLNDCATTFDIGYDLPEFVAWTTSRLTSVSGRIELGKDGDYLDGTITMHKGNLSECFNMKQPLNTLRRLVNSFAGTPHDDE